MTERRHASLDNNTSKEHNATDLSSVAKNFAFLTGIYLYFVGWAYLYLYFRHFGVSLLGLEIPLTFFFVYAYPLATTALTWIKFALVIIMIGLVATVVTQNRMTKLRKGAVLLLTLVLFPLSFEAARQTAEANAISFRQGYGAKIVQFKLEKEARNNFPAKFIEANENHELLLLLETKDRFYAVYQPPDSTKELPMASTFSVDRAKIAIAEVDVTNVSIKR